MGKTILRIGGNVMKSSSSCILVISLPSQQSLIDIVVLYLASLDSKDGVFLVSVCISCQPSADNPQPCHTQHWYRPHLAYDSTARDSNYDRYSTLLGEQLLSYYDCHSM